LQNAVANRFSSAIQFRNTKIKETREVAVCCINERLCIETPLSRLPTTLEMIRRKGTTLSQKELTGNLRCPIGLESSVMKPIAAFLLFSFSVFAQVSSNGGVVPKQGFVPNESVALAIAEAVLVPVYRKSVVDSERPFKAVLKSNVWTVSGSVQCDPPGSICPGGAAEVRISKKTGQILFMTHYQ
jgi:hypothetical protein